MQIHVQPPAEENQNVIEPQDGQDQNNNQNNNQNPPQQEFQRVVVPLKLTKYYGDLTSALFMYGILSFFANICVLIQSSPKFLFMIIIVLYCLRLGYIFNQKKCLKLQLFVQKTQFKKRLKNLYEFFDTLFTMFLALYFVFVSTSFFQQSSTFCGLFIGISVLYVIIDIKRRLNSVYYNWFLIAYIVIMFLLPIGLLFIDQYLDDKQQSSLDNFLIVLSIFTSLVITVLIVCCFHIVYLYLKKKKMTEEQQLQQGDQIEETIFGQIIHITYLVNILIGIILFANVIQEAQENNNSMDLSIILLVFQLTYGLLSFVFLFKQQQFLSYQSTFIYQQHTEKYPIPIRQIVVAHQNSNPLPNIIQNPPDDEPLIEISTKDKLMFVIKRVSSILIQVLEMKKVQEKKEQIVQESIKSDNENEDKMDKFKQFHDSPKVELQLSKQNSICSSPPLKNMPLQQLQQSDMKSQFDYVKEKEGENNNTIDQKSQVDKETVRKYRSQPEFAFRKQSHKQSVKKIQTQTLCLVCYELPQESFYYPCGHSGYCLRCAKKILIETKKCPYCRKLPSFIMKLNMTREEELLAKSKELEVESLITFKSKIKAHIHK